MRAPSCRRLAGCGRRGHPRWIPARGGRRRLRSSVPTIARTMCLRNPSPSMSNTSSAAILANCQFPDGPDRVLGFGSCRLKRGEVVTAHEHGGRSPHGRRRRGGRGRARRTSDRRARAPARSPAGTGSACRPPRIGHGNRAGASSTRSTRTSAGSRKLSARRSVAEGSAVSIVTLATCPSACTPASVRPAPATAGASPTMRLERALDELLDGDTARLPLPADVVRAVIGDGQFEAAREASVPTPFASPTRRRCRRRRETWTSRRQA